jgi:hypothetical protein
MALPKPQGTAKTGEGMHFLLYGKPKSGKTTTLGECGFKVLLADLEGGSAVLEGATNIDRIPIEKWEELIELGAAVKQGYIDYGNGEKFIIDHDLVVIDSISRVQDLCKEWVATVYAPNRKREIQGKFGAQSDWGDLKDKITGTVKAFHALTKRGDNSIHVGWIAHEAIQTDDVTGLPTNTKIQLQGKDTADTIMSVVDAIFYMVKSVQPDPNDEKKQVIKYGILTEQSGIFQAAVRQSKFNKEAKKLPSAIMNPHWKTIFETLGYHAK